VIVTSCYVAAIILIAGISAKPLAAVGPLTLRLFRRLPSCASSRLCWQASEETDIPAVPGLGSTLIELPTIGIAAAIDYILEVPDRTSRRPDQKDVKADRNRRACL
jgi:hypothetical protein